MKTISKILLWDLVLLFFSTLWAQEISVEVLSLDDLLNLEVSVASKSDETASDAPSSVTVFSYKEIKNMGITTLDELLNYVPGFQVTRDIEQGTANRFSSRGRGSALSESILFLLNGNRINDLYTGGASLLNRNIPIENIKQIEIIRGPGSALYGSNAFLGVVNIVTKTEGNSLVISYGENKFTEISVNYGHKFENELEFQTFIQISKNEGYEYSNISDIFGYTANTSDPIVGQDANFQMKYKDLILSMRYMQRRLNDFMTFGGLANSTNQEETYQTSFNLKYQKSFNKISLSTGAGYSFDKWNTKALLIPKDLEIAPGFALSENFIGGPILESYNLNLYADFTFDFEKNKLIAGIQLENTGITDAANIMTHHPIELEYQGRFKRFDGDLSFNKDEKRTILGLYIQNKFSASENLTLIAGLRYDNYNDFGTSFNPRAALIYKFPFKGKVKVMYGRAFRAPNFLELYDKNNPVDFGNPDLDAEKVQTIEFSYIHTFEKLQFTGNYFYNKIEDIIVLSNPIDHPNNPLGAPTFINQGELKTQGLEFEVKSSPFSNVIVNLTYTHIFDGDNLPSLSHDGLQVSHNFGSFIINANFNKLNINVSGIYRDKMDVLPSQDSYLIINSSAKYHITSNLFFKLSVKNLFDKDFYTYTNTAGLPMGIINPGRQIYCSINIDL